MQLQHGRNSNFKSHSQKWTSQNRTGENQDSQRMEDTNKDQECRKLSRICELLQIIHSKLQPYSETIK